MTAPFHDASLVNGGGPHSQDAVAADVDGGLMDGFVRESETVGGRGCGGFSGVCSSLAPSDVMGYHDAREIPNYWAYAENFVLDDHMFQSDASWSLPAHLYEVSEWSARCSRPGDPSSCVNDDELGGYQTSDIIGVGTRGRHAANRVRKLLRTARRRLRRCRFVRLAAPPAAGGAPIGTSTRYSRAVAQCRRRVNDELAKRRATLARQVSTTYNYAWTDITYLLHKDGVSWGYFITPGGEPDCEGGNANCSTRRSAPRPGHLEPAPVVHRRPPGRPTGTHPGRLALPQGRHHRQPARGLLGNPLSAALRSPSREHLRRPGVRHQPDQHDHGGPDWTRPRSSSCGTTGRLLRSRAPAGGGQNGYGFRVPSLVDQSLCA